MSHSFQPQTLAVLNLLAQHESLNRLEIERTLGIAQTGHVINRLRQGMHITPLPKERGQLARYKITNSGRNVIGAHIQRQDSLRSRPISELPLYVPKETPVRPGSMRAYSLPSRGMQ